MKLKTKLLHGIIAMMLVSGHQVRGAVGADGMLTGRYWFDQSATSTSFTPGHLEIPTSGLPEGLHTFNAFVQNGAGTQSSVMTQWFVKTLGILPGGHYKTIVFVDGMPFQTVDNQAAGQGTLSFPLDVNSLPLGIHTLQAQVVSPTGIASDVKETMFMRMPSTAQLGTMTGYYTLDNKLAGELRPAVNGGVYHLDIDASALTSGLHSVSVYLASPVGLITSMNTAWFVKTPLGGEGVKRYEYWLNDDYTRRTSVVLDKVTDPLQLISLVEVAQQPFRTSSFAFAVEDGREVVYPRNDFHVYFFDPDERLTEGSTSYTDVRGRREVGDMQTVDAPINVFSETVADGDIKWYRFEGEVGDSVATRLSGAGMLELYGPDGSKIIERSGANASTIATATLAENGTHYLAVHDIAQRSRKTDVILDHISRFAICSFTPEKCASSGMLIINVRGNGFDNLTEASLTGGSVGRLMPETVTAVDNYNIALLFNLKQLLAVGEYNIECVFTDPESATVETVISAKPLIIEEPVSGKIKVDIVDSRKAATPYMSAVRVTNTGNVPYYCVPFNVAIPYPEDGETIHFTGFCEDDNEDGQSIFTTSDNILDTGQKGAFVNAVIPYLAPGESRTYEVGFTTRAMKRLTWYAWCGKPWSEEIKEMEAENYDLQQILTPSGLNYLTIRDYAHFLYLAANGVAPAQNGPNKAPAMAPPSGNPLNIAAQLAVGTGKTTLGISARGAMNPIAIRQQGNQMLLDMIGYNPYVSNMVNTDAGMLQVGGSLLNAAGTDNNTFGNVEALGHLLNARRQWQDAVHPNPETDPLSTVSNPSPHTTTCYQSGDPNDMLGYTSPSGDKYVGLDVDLLDYTIEFENDPQIANAAATVIKVDNTLDPKIFDLATFKAVKMTIGDKVTELPEGHHFVKTLDMRPEINSIAELTFDYDASTGEASWLIRTLDPQSLEPTRYIDDGVLPVNDGTDRGIGFLSYTIGLQGTLADGTEIANKAVIVFDDNDPIETPVYRLETDYLAPEAKILSRTTDDNKTIDFEIEATDSGSGIWYVDLYMRPADSETWILVKPRIEESTFTYTSEQATDGADWTVVAVDRAGNSQSKAFLNALPGDADGNGMIDASDVVVIRNFYMDSSVKINKANADVNVDSSVDAQDAAITRNLYLGEEIMKTVNKIRRWK